MATKTTLMPRYNSVTSIGNKPVQLFSMYNYSVY